MKTLIMFMMPALFASLVNASEPLHEKEFSNSNGYKTVRSSTLDAGNISDQNKPRLPIRNPMILAQVVWVDRNHQNAVAEDVSISPDGYGIFTGWWLNNERFSAYVSTGIQWPNWVFSQEVDWMLPVAASDEKYAGTNIALPVNIWDHNSPLFSDQYNFDSGFRPRGVAFSGDGGILAAVAENGSQGKLVTYDVLAQDTIYTRTFDLTSSLNGIDISSDGSTIVVSMYSSLLVYSVPGGELLSTLYNYSQNMAKVSGDGSLIAIGTFSGTFYLYEWDGSDYGYRFVRPIQHDWVTAVDVADNGSTTACGTLDFEGSNIAGGKFVMWDAVTGDVLIEYNEYGDEVSSVALSADGQYAAVGSWGQYQGTYGDVVTCFIRDTDIPIFQLLDDVDEPGSVFSVAISDSGNYVTAGGKAVHAREFGNGGMVYSIQLHDPLEYDAAVASIDEPGELVMPGEAVTPSATFINVGLNGVGFTTNCTITNLENDEVIYNSTYYIDYLGSFMTSSVFFIPDFTVPSEGRFIMEFTAVLENDQDESNNELSLILRSWHDIKAASIISPFNEVTFNWPCTPVALFTNFGSYYETINVTVSVYDADDTQVFTSTNTIIGLPPYGSEEVIFENWYPEITGTYRVEYTADVTDDIYPDDNTIENTFEVVNEMIYDDGQLDASIWVGTYPNSTNRKFAARFEPNLAAPFSVTNVRFLQPDISYDGAFDYVAVAKEDAYYPDTTNYLTIIQDPQLPGPGNWANFPMNVAMYESEPLWFVLHWADATANGPFIGADNTGIIDNQSYWYSNENGWNQWQFHDWMIRMTLQEGTGIESEYVMGLPLRITLMNNYPNPFNSSTKISFGIPNQENIEIEIFNSLGQKVRLLTDSQYEAGYHTVVWDGKSDQNSDVATGIYYCRLSSGDQRVSQKMLLLK